MKNLLFIIIALAITLLGTTALAEITKPDNLKLVMKNDIINPKGSGAFTCSNIEGYANWEKTELSAMYDWDDNEYWRIRVHGLRNIKGPLGIGFGFSNDNSGQSFIWPGFSLSGKLIGKLSAYFSFDYYLPTNNDAKGNGFGDPFLSLSYPVSIYNKEITLGVDYWDDFCLGSWRWNLIGPWVSFNLTDNTSLLLRYSRDWFRITGLEKKTTESDTLRIQITIDQIDLFK